MESPTLNDQNFKHSHIIYENSIRYVGGNCETCLSETVYYSISGQLISHVEFYDMQDKYASVNVIYINVIYIYIQTNLVLGIKIGANFKVLSQNLTMI